MSPELRQSIVHARTTNYTTIMSATIFAFAIIGGVLHLGDGAYSAPLMVLTLVVTAFGILAGGAALPATVIPFLLRGVNLLGIDSVMQPYENRLRAWERIAKDLPMDKLEAMVHPAKLGDLPQLGADILKGQVKGRVVVDVNG